MTPQRNIYGRFALMIYIINVGIYYLKNNSAQQLWAGAPKSKTGGSIINNIQNRQSIISKNSDSNPIMDGVCSLPAFNPCIPEATCVPSVPIIGEATCQCPDGYSGDGRKNGTGCVNIDECRTGTHDCDLETMDCIDYQGTYECLCKSGYGLSPSGKVCLDIDECHDPSLNNCDPEAMTCRNLQGSYQCDCKNPNQIKDESTKLCRDLDECHDMDGAMNPCDQICINRNPGVECSCNIGYALSSDKRSCEDINECLDPYLHACDPSGIISVCVNTQGGYYCECNNNQGYSNTGDGFSCKNFNECEEYPYICGGARSCCKDLAPPERFACMIPGNQNIQAITNEINEAGGLIMPFGDVSGIITDTIQNFSPLIGMEANTRNLAGKPINLFELLGKLKLPCVIMLFEITDVHKSLKNYDGEPVVLIAGEMDLSDFYQSSARLFSANQRALQLLPALFTSGPLQMNNKNRPSSNTIFQNNFGGLRAIRGNSCPDGFMMGADLQRARTRKAAMQAVQSALTSNSRDAYGNQKPVNPEEVTDSIVKNTAAVSQELQKWILELSSVPQEVIQAAGPLSSPLDSVERDAVPLGNSGLANANILGLNAEDLATLLIGGGIGKLIECDPANDPFCDRTGKSTKLAYGSG